MQRLRWGILGTAGIASKAWSALKKAPSNVLVAVASRDLARCEAFISENQGRDPQPSAVRAMPSYEALIASTDIDAVYVPLPTAVRKPWVLKAARAGKHVLCEKPCAVSSEDLEEMIETCRKHSVQFMDGVMFMHNARMEQVRHLLNSSSAIGDIRRISSSFSFAGPKGFFTSNIRVRSDTEPAGCLGDLGWYCIRFALWSMNWEMPVEVSGKILTGYPSAKGGDTPVEFSGELVFKGGASAGFYCSFLAPSQQWVSVSGTSGWLRVDDFVHPADPHEVAITCNHNLMRVPTCDLWSPEGEPLKLPQEVSLYEHFSAQVRSGGLSTQWPEWSRKTQQVVDRCLKSARQAEK